MTAVTDRTGSRFRHHGARALSARGRLLAPPARPLREIDPWLIWPVVTLLLVGLVMVYSASVATAEGRAVTGFQPGYFALRHALYLALGVVAGTVAFQLPMAAWQRLAPWVFICACVLLVLVLIPLIGREINGARRWLAIGPMQLQPSEFMKLAVVLYAASYTARKLAVMGSFKRGFLPMASVMLVVGFLLLREPDFGAFVVIVCIAMGILFLGGINARLYFLLTVALGVGFVLLILVSPYRRDRVLFFVDPFQDELGKGYQLAHALYAFSRGEWFGVGLGASMEKLFYLPEAHTDFLLAGIGEELGFAGVAAIIVLFAMLTQRAFAVARQSISLERIFGGLVAYGVGIWLGMQSIFNIGVNLGVLPTKGLTLPLMSYGGSGILANCLALGLLFRVDYENRQLMSGGSK